MALPVPNLDDRRFDDLVAEATDRLQSHLPELTQLAPGDPMHSFVDLMAWMTETILYRANLIPERQRRVILNLLQIPERPAQAARGVVCVDAQTRDGSLPPLMDSGVQMNAGGEVFTGLGELQATPLQLSISIKRAVGIEELDQLGFTLNDLREQYGMRADETPISFQPQTFQPGVDTLSLAQSIDKAYYLTLSVKKQLRDKVGAIRDAIAGITLNVAIAPSDSVIATEAADLTPRTIEWQLIHKDSNDTIRYLPLEVLSDTSSGGRRVGVVRLRLPSNPAMFGELASDDPIFSGVGDLPPEPPAKITAEQIVAWLRVSCPDEPDLPLGYMGVNAVDVIGQGLRRNLIVGIGTGQPDQIVRLPDNNIDKGSLVLEVEEDGAWVRWKRVDYLTGLGAYDKVYRLDASTGTVTFGNGINRGKRVPEGRRIRIVRYLFGGGEAGNLPADKIKELTGGGSRLKLRHEWPTSGGQNAESVEQAEQRIPQFLTHRNRAVTQNDFRLLAENNPIAPIGRADVIEGFVPGASISAARANVPGAVSVFVRPPGAPSANGMPKPTKGLLKDVFSYLLQRIVIGTELYVLSPEYIPIAVSVAIDVRDSKTEQQTLKAVNDALHAYLWQLAPGGLEGQGWELGATVRGNELIAQLARVAGVRAINGLSMFTKIEGIWKKINPVSGLVLLSYQLPELLAVDVIPAQIEPGLPESLTPAQAPGKQIPTPIIPDVC